MKLTKKAALAANEDIQEKIGFKPELDTKLKTDELYKELYKKTLEMEIDDDDRETLEESTFEVIDALAEMFPNISLNKKGVAVEAEPEVEEAEVVEEEKPKKEKKSKKGKKEKKSKKEPEPEEEAEEEEEKPVKKSKKSKKSKGKVDPAELAEQIKTDKKINRDGLYAIVNDNADLFGDAAETLLTITNPMVLKKQMRNVLEGGEVEMTKTKPPTKKAKKEKVVEKTLTEKVNEFEDFDELKAFAKENKGSFPGVKAKKFSKLKKLRKALLEVVVEDAPKGKKEKKSKGESRDLETIRAERQKRIDWITDFINKAGGKVGRKKLTAKALEKFPNPAKAIRDLISYAKNPKYNKFEKLMVEVDGVIGWEGELDTTPKKSKKGKKAEVVEEVAEEPVKEKKNKKGKKDKKNKKGKKSKKKDTLYSPNPLY